MEVVAIFGLLTVVNLVALLAFGVLLYRHDKQIQHLGAVAKTLTHAWKETSGQEIRVDPSLLGFEPDDVAPDDEETPFEPPAGWGPWKVKE